MQQGVQAGPGEPADQGGPDAAGGAGDEQAEGECVGHAAIIAASPAKRQHELAGVERRGGFRSRPLRDRSGMTKERGQARIPSLSSLRSRAADSGIQSYASAASGSQAEPR
ncbi:hypothetical protein GCM10017083_37200 [Thalassobaculum fulvum]|uniref:Uncharacterized protein n=1 Tax=Thalassobaculum fulvum TaxID=1633335 RepID=A0A918XVR9_9PROT|nr:hypothetical protein GCM10017083_37200 [Thalassobaculum fulvum]